MSNPVNETRIGEVTRKGDFYRIDGITKDGRRGSVEIPVSTLESMKRSDGDKLMKRGVYATAESDKNP